MFGYSSADHYTFTDIGHGVFSSDTAHLSVPISIAPLQTTLSHIHGLANQLERMSKRFGHSKPGGPFLKTLSNYADEQFLQIEQKFQTVLFFYTRKPEYETSTVYDTLTNRKMSMSKLVPDPILRAPNIPFFEPVSNRRSMPDPTTISLPSCTSNNNTNNTSTNSTYPRTTSSNNHINNIFGNNNISAWILRLFRICWSY
jgi:hypothetical protein